MEWVVSIWIICGVINYGAFVADMQAIWDDMPQQQKIKLPTHRLKGAIFALGGPLALPGIIIISRVFRNGFKF